MNRHLRWFFAFLILWTGSFAFLSGTGYANPGGFDVPEVREDLDQFEHNPGTQSEQPIYQTQVQAEEKGFWDKTTESLKEGWQWFKDKGSEFINWTKEKASERSKVSTPRLPMLSWMPWHHSGTGSWSIRELRLLS